MMDATFLFSELRRAVQEVQKDGQQFIAVPALLDYLSQLEKDAPAASEARKMAADSQLAYYNAQHASNLAYFAAERESGREMFRSVLEAAKVATTTPILINGGGAVALLAFLGSMQTKATIFSAAGGLGMLPLALAVFAFGVLAAAIATGTTYVTQYLYECAHQKSGIAFHVATVVLVIASYVLFAAAIRYAYLHFNP